MKQSVKNADKLTSVIFVHEYKDISITLHQNLEL